MPLLVSVNKNGQKVKKVEIHFYNLFFLFKHLRTVLNALCLLLMTVSTAATFTPVQSHTLVRHQLHCPSSQRVTPHQLIIQQSSSAHRQVQPIALRVTPQDSSPPPLAPQTRTTPTTATVQSQHTEFLSVPSSANQPANQSAVVSMSTVPPAALPDPPPLHLGPVLEPVSQHSPLACPPPLTMGLPRLVQPQRLSLRSVQTAAAQSDHMVSEEEHPAAEAVVQLPFQNLPPPQTVAVDLKMQPATQTEAPSVSLVWFIMRLNWKTSIRNFCHHSLQILFPFYYGTEISYLFKDRPGCSFPLKNWMWPGTWIWASMN